MRVRSYFDGLQYAFYGRVRSHIRNQGVFIFFEDKTTINCGFNRTHGTIICVNCFEIRHELCTLKTSEGIAVKENTEEVNDLL